MSDPLATLRTALEEARQASAAVADATSRDFIKAEKAEAAAWSAVSAALEGVKAHTEGVELLLWCIVSQAGGEIVVPVDIMQSAGPDCRFELERRHSDDARIVRALQGTPHAD